MSNPNSEELSNEPGDVTNMSMQDDVTKIRQRIDINDDGRPNTRNSMYANKSRRGSMISMSTPTVKTGSTVYHTPGSSPAPQISDGVGRNEEYNDEGVVGVSLLTPVLQPRQPPQHPNTTQNLSTMPYNHYYPQHPQQQLSLGQYQQPAFNPYNSSYYQHTAHAYASTYGYDASHFTQVPIQPTSTDDKSQSSSNTSSNTSESSTPPLRRFESHSIPIPPSQDDSGRSSLLNSRSEPEPTRGMDSFLVALRSGSQVSSQQVSGEAEVTAVAHRVETLSVSSLSNRTAKAVHASRDLPRPNPRQPERQIAEESELESSKSFANFLPNHSILHYQAPRVALGADSQDKSILADESQSYIDEQSNADQSVQHEESMNKSFLKFFKSGGSKNGSIRMKFATGLESIRGKRKDTNSSSGTSSVVGEEAVGTRGVSGRGPPPPPSLTSRDGSVVSSQNSSLHQQSKGNGSAQFQTFHSPQDARPVRKEPQDVEQITRVNSDHVSSRTTQSSNLRRSYNQVSSPAHSAKSVDSSDPSQETPRAPKRDIAQDTTPPPVLRPSPRGPGREVPRRMTVEDIQQHQDVLASTKNRLYEQTDLQPPPIPPKRSPLRKSSTDPRLGSNTVSSVSHTPVRQEPQYPQERLQTQHISSASRQPQPRPLRADASLPNLIQKVEAFKDISTSSSGLSPNDFSVSSSGRQHRHSTPAQYASTDNSDYSASELESCVVDYSILEVEGDFSQTTTDTPSFAISPNNKNRPVPEYSIDEDSSVFEEESQDCSVSRTEDAYQTADEDSAIHYELPLPPPTSVVSRSSLSNAPVNNRPSAPNRKRKVLPVVPSAPDNTIAYGNSSRPSPPRSQTQSTPQRNSTARNNYEMSLTPVSAERFLAGLKAVSRKPSKF